MPAHDSSDTPADLVQGPAALSQTLDSNLNLPTDKHHLITKNDLTSEELDLNDHKSPLGRLLLSRRLASSSSSLETLSRSQTLDSILSSDDSTNTQQSTSLLHELTNNDQNNATNTTLINDYFYKTQFKPQTTSILRPGSKFVGSQQSGRSIYQVEVELQYVDLSKAYLNGFLKIQGLTESHPEIITFFESEIISEDYSFFTEDSNSDILTSNDIDIQHWSKFQNWKNKLPTKKIISKNYTHKDFLKFENVYMRWKEKFLVPDHKIDNIEGASFAGFYYINFNQTNGNINGLYYHKSSEKFQQLELCYVEENGIGGSFQFQ